MRTPLLLLFLLSFLLQGVMLVHANDNYCPMHEHDSSVMMQGMDCCNDPQTVAETGQQCKTDIACVVAGVSVPSQAADSKIGYSIDRVYSIVFLANSAQQLAAIWRPPALI